MAAQGRGDGVYVGPLETAKQDCANPSQFDEQSATLSGANLEFTPSWVEAYVGSPALASSRNSVSDVQWDLIVEGSNHAPELEPTTHIGYALGHARVATDEGGDWRLDTWESSESPKVGDDPPSCLDGSCDGNRSVREPHLLAELNDEQRASRPRAVVRPRAGERARASATFSAFKSSGRWVVRPPRSRCRHADALSRRDPRMRQLA